MTSGTAAPGSSVRVISIAVVRSGGAILLERGEDPDKPEKFLRAVGGGVQFQERALDAVVREWREELGATLTSLVPLGVIENIFTYLGRPRHEIVFVHAASVQEQWLYEREELTVVEPARDGQPACDHQLVWSTIAKLRADRTPVYPSGLLDLLEE